MPEKTALLVIDMQNDYLKDGRKPMFSYDTDALTANVNRAIRSYQKQGADIIYIAQVFQNLPTNRLLIGFTIKGTEGAALYDDMARVSELYFEKYFSDAYTCAAFRQHMQKEGYTKVVLCGLDECGCVGATAKGAAKNGVQVIMLEDCIGRRFPDAKVQKMRKKLKTYGVVYQTLAE
ncbi:MAG TPA: isochorismatase [Ruminococcus sp.]|nr:isochorismatase [Ruminococcus sp.]